MSKRKNSKINVKDENLLASNKRGSILHPRASTKMLKLFISKNVNKNTKFTEKYYEEEERIYADINKKIKSHLNYLKILQKECKINNNATENIINDSNY